jgi:hypothetical protein
MDVDIDKIWEKLILEDEGIQLRQTFKPLYT